jgi:hypothetical protein
MSNDVGRPLIAPERTFERRRGCWNCKSFQNEDLAKNLWKTHRQSLVMKVASMAPMGRLGDMESGVTPMGGDSRMSQIRLMDEGIAMGAIGICLKGCRSEKDGGPAGDFVDCRFLCDRWDGRDGHSVSTAGKPLDKLNDELREIADDRAKKK